jgi:hypothetical protein
MSPKIQASAPNAVGYNQPSTVNVFVVDVGSIVDVVDTVVM